MDLVIHCLAIIEVKHCTAVERACARPILVRIHLMYEATRTTKLDNMRLGADMRLEDLVAAYAYRRVQIAHFIHVCHIGYCKQTWHSACRFHMPVTQLEPEIRQDDSIDRMQSRRSHLPDDSWVVVHILSCVLR